MAKFKYSTPKYKVYKKPDPQDQVWEAMQGKIGLTIKRVEKVCRDSRVYCISRKNLREYLKGLETLGLVTITVAGGRYYYSDKTAFENDTGEEGAILKAKLERQKPLELVRQEMSQLMARHGFENAVKIDGNNVSVKLNLDLAKEWVGFLRQKL